MRADESPDHRAEGSGLRVDWTPPPAEESIEESRDCLAALFERAPDANLLVGDNGVLARVNRAAEEMLKFDGQRVVGRSLLDLGIVPQNETARVVELLSSLTDGAERLPEEFVLRRGDGGRVEVEITSSAVSVGGRTLALLAIHDIADRKQMEHALSVAEERQCVASELASGFTYSQAVEKDGRLGYWWAAEAAWRISGFTTEEIVSRGGWHHLIHPDDLATASSQLLSLLRGDAVEYEYRVVTKTGEVRRMRDRARPVRGGEDGSVMRIEGAVWDVTEQWEAVQSLAREAKSWQHVCDGMPDAVMIVSDEYEVVRANRAAQDVYACEDLAGARCYEVVHGADKPPSECPTQWALRTGERAHCEMQEPSLGGRWFDVSVEPVEDGTSGRRHFVHVARDRTNNKLAEEALAATQANFHSIVEMTADGVVIVDGDGVVRFANRAAELLFGRTGVELVGSRLGFPLLVGETAEVDIVRKYGGLGTGEMRSVATVWAGAPAYLVSIRDVSEHKRILAELDDTRQRQLKIKDQFLSNVSHELRSPLTVVRQFTTIVLDGLAGEVNPEQCEYLQIAVRNVDELRRMIEELLEATRTETGRLVVERHQVQLADLITQSVADLQATAAAKRITLSADVSSQLPTAVCDPTRIREVLSNLVENAIKFTPEGGGVAVRAFASQESPGFLCVAVADTGPGICPDDRERIFEHLYQVNPDAEAGRKGIGLGLYICRELVSRQGGRIWVKSDVGEGSTFYFTIPIYSLADHLAPVLTRKNLRKGSVSIVRVSVLHERGRTFTRADAKTILRDAREIVRTCSLPDVDVLLPSAVRSKDEEILLVVSCSDVRGSGVLARRIEEQLAQFPKLEEAGLSVVVSPSTIEFPPPDDDAGSEEQLACAAAVVGRVEQVLTRLLDEGGEERRRDETRQDTGS
jgi:PAS domain S-box-containing protein